MAWMGFWVGCGPREPALVNPGVSTVNRIGGSSTPVTADAGAPGDPGVDLQTVRAIGKAFVSRGHFAGRWNAQVSVNDAARSSYASLVASTRFTEGSVLVKRHVAAATSATPGPIFVMAKRAPGFFTEGGDWEYIALDAEGRLQDRGKLALCARCHAEANADKVFGLPTGAE
jgi:hypothetical protein